jgi:hypothetical protein
MRRALGLLLAAVLGVGVLTAIVVSVRSRAGAAGSQALTVVHGVIGSEKGPFFSDAQVLKDFRDHGLDVKVDVAGSRQIATSFDLSHIDFAFPAGVPAADKIKRDRKINTSYQPFYTPMAIASFKPIAQLLVNAGVAKDQGGYYTFDMAAYMKLVGQNARWSDLPRSAELYPGSTRSILITSTDIRTSNSAAMYLAIASYVANGNNIVQNPAQGASVLPQVEPLFLRQGYTSNSSEGPFQDYLTIGMGKTPLVMIYEAQYVALAAANDGSITKDMVLMYPSPTTYSKHTLVPLTSAGDRVGRLLTSDPDLQRLAIKYGFRTNDTAAFNKFVTAHKVVLPQTLFNVVEPPAYDALESMISTIEQHMKGVTP